MFTRQEGVPAGTWGDGPRPAGYDGVPLGRRVESASEAAPSSPGATEWIVTGGMCFFLGALVVFLVAVAWSINARLRSIDSTLQLISQSLSSGRGV
jgi:hypothetical protein